MTNEELRTMNLEQIKSIVERSNQEQIDSVERISELAKTLIDLRKLEAEIIGELQVLTENLAVGMADLKAEVAPEDRMIETLGLSTKTFNRIVGEYGRHREESPFQTIRDILNVPLYGWHKVIGCGSKAMAKEIEDKMHEAGFTDFKICLAKGYKAGLIDYAQTNA